MNKERFIKSDEGFKSLKMLSLYFRDFSQAMCLVDREGLIKDANPAFYKLLGYLDEDLQGKSLKDLELRLPGGPEKFYWQVNSSSCTRKTQYRLRNGKVLNVEEEATRFFLDGDEYCLLWIKADVGTGAGDTSSSIINSLLKLFLRTSSKQEFLDRSLKIIYDLTGVTCAGIRVADEQGNIPYVSYLGFSEQFIQKEKWLSTRHDKCACIRVILGEFERQDLSEITEGGSFCCNDTFNFLAKLNEREKSRFRGVCVQSGYKSLAVIPILYAGKILGAVHLADEREGMFKPGTVEFLESSVAPIIGEGVYRFGVEERLQHNYEIQSILTSLLKLSLEDLTLKEILNSSLKLINSSPLFSPGAKSSIFLVEDRLDSLVLQAEKGFSEEYRACSRVQFGECLCGKVALSREITFKKHSSEPCESKHMETGPHSHYCVPILQGKTVLGVINIYLEEEHRSDQREQEFLMAVANALAGIIWRKRSENKLRALSQRLVNIQEEERRAIALELHDQIGQMLTGLKLMVNQASRTGGAEQNLILGEVQQAISELMVKVREMSLKLRPSMLDDLGLLPTLLWLFQQSRTGAGLNIDFRHSGLDRKFPKDVSIAAYRIVQEALTNAMRYAGVKDISVDVRVMENNLHITVEDRGIGFNPEAISLSKSVGLQGMRERALLLGGKLMVESSPGTGTRITAELPLVERGADTNQPDFPGNLPDTGIPEQELNDNREGTKNEGGPTSGKNR